MKIIFSFRFIIYSFLIIIIKAGILEDYKCYEPNSDQLKLGEDVVLCIHIISNPININKKVGIKIKVDEYSVVSVDGIYDISRENEKSNIELLAQIGKITSVFPTVRLYIYKNIIFRNIFMKIKFSVCLI